MNWKHSRDEGGTERPARSARRSERVDDAALQILQPLEIVGEVANSVFETIRRHWWRAFDRLCGCFVFARLFILDRLFGPEPATPADPQREADHEQLVKAFPAVGDAIEQRGVDLRGGKEAQ